MRTPITTTRFEKELGKAKKRGLNLLEIKEVIQKLISNTPLPMKHQNHLLTGDYVGYWECHIRPDWLLIYKLDDEKKHHYFCTNRHTR